MHDTARKLLYLLIGGTRAVFGFKKEKHPLISKCFSYAGGGGRTRTGD